MSQLLENLLLRRKQPNQHRGIYSVCSAHSLVLRAAMKEAIAYDSPLLIEATSNQVNQFGGYTGMKPEDFRNMVFGLAAKEGLPLDRIILGGDHLGPNPWLHLPAEEAMIHAKEMLRVFAKAGFTKLHLDASMSCGGDPLTLSNKLVAERAAELCAAAEEAASGERPSYIIGTEVPIPGGATESLTHIQVTRPEDAEETLRVHREVFLAHGLHDAWERVLGLVVQPGVEFNHDSVVHYASSAGKSLKNMLSGHPGLVFEAHSTDYQRPEAYRELVQDGFAILKVGPALTFAMREALFALAAVESELLPAMAQSRLPEVMEEVMLASPAHWAKHYVGDARTQRLLRRYSYSDRIRYYWNEREPQDSVARLMEGLSGTGVPETLLSAWLPLDYLDSRENELTPQPESIVLRHIQRAIRPYARACFA